MTGHVSRRPMDIGINDWLELLPHTMVPAVPSSRTVKVNQIDGQKKRAKRKAQKMARRKNRPPKNQGRR